MNLHACESGLAVYQSYAKQKCLCDIDNSLNLGRYLFVFIFLVCLLTESVVDNRKFYLRSSKNFPF